MRIGGGFFQGRDGHSPCNVLLITTQTNSRIREHKVQKKVRWNIPECLQDCSRCFNLNSVVEFKESNLKPLQGIDKKESTNTVVQDLHQVQESQVIAANPPQTVENMSNFFSNPIFSVLQRRLSKPLKQWVL
jgi:type II secretory pathway component PulK